MPRLSARSRARLRPAALALGALAVLLPTVNARPRLQPGPVAPRGRPHARSSGATHRKPLWFAAPALLALLAAVALLQPGRAGRGTGAASRTRFGRVVASFLLLAGLVVAMPAQAATQTTTGH